MVHLGLHTHLLLLAAVIVEAVMVIAAAAFAFGASVARRRCSG